MKIIVTGAAGRMGSALRASIGEGYRGAELAAAVDLFAKDGEFLPRIDDFEGDADAIVDFSNHTSAPELCAYAVRRGLPIVIATTGHTPEELGAIKAASASVPVFHSANMSLGVAVLCDLTRRAVRMFPDADIEITEAHHNRKLDAPSGTALMLADSVISERPESHLVYGRAGQAKREKNEIGIHALRMGSVVGEHTVYIATDTQILTLSHSAQSRSVFAEGALAAAEFIIGRAPGFYKMEDVLRG